MPMPLYQAIARKCNAWRNCHHSRNDVWKHKHQRALYIWEDVYLPKGSGFDAGTKIQPSMGYDGCEVLTSSYHHMDENGHYSHWSSFEVKILPDLQFGFRLEFKILSGDVSESDLEYFHEIFDILLFNENPES